MRLAKGLIMGAWLLVVINLLMSLGAIGIFMRMTPAIAEILTKNERSLQACEKMLAALALAKLEKKSDQKLLKEFSAAFVRARQNVTEIEEPTALDKIGANFKQAFLGDAEAIKSTVEATINLGDINRIAMAKADKTAQQLGNGGAWGIVFMAICSFLVGVTFIKNFSQKFLVPIEEIKVVLLAHKNGETRRRCAGNNLPTEIRAIFGDLNNVLDKSLSNSLKEYEK